MAVNDPPSSLRDPQNDLDDAPYSGSDRSKTRAALERVGVKTMTEYVDGADYGVEPVSNEEKVAIATHMLMSSPPGQFRDILTDVRKLLPEGLLDDGKVAEIAKAYNAQEGTIVEIGDHSGVLAEEGAVGGEGFKDPQGAGGIFLVDHVAAQVTGEAPAADDDGAEPEASDPALEELRRALQDQLEAYRANFFSGAEKSAACVFVKDGGLVAYVSACKYNLRNWWSGSWVGRYTVTIREGSLEVRGSTAVRGHYFEDGNIQLQTSNDVPPETFESSACAGNRKVLDVLASRSSSRKCDTLTADKWITGADGAAPSSQMIPTREENTVLESFVYQLFQVSFL